MEASCFPADLALVHPLLLHRLRSGVMGVLFRASLLSRKADASSSCAGDINTLMAVDAGRLANLALSVQELLSLPLQILAAMTLLYLQVGIDNFFKLAGHGKSW
jgi:hypothetical protein